MGSQCSCMTHDGSMKSGEIATASSDKASQVLIASNLPSNTNAIIITKTHDEQEFHSKEESPNMRRSLRKTRNLTSSQQHASNDFEKTSFSGGLLLHDYSKIPSVNLLEVRDESKLLHKGKSNESEKVDMSQDITDGGTSKKAVSFFHFASLESKLHHGNLHFGSQLNGDVWKLANIRLDVLVQKGSGKFLWEGRNFLEKKKCAIKVSKIESTKLAFGYNVAKTETLLRDLTNIKCPNILEIYSFSILETESHNRQYLGISIVQEVVKCSLRDAHELKIKRKEIWTENQLLVILRDIYNGLFCCRSSGLNITHGKLKLENVLISEDLQRILIADFDMLLPIVSEGRRSTAGSFPLALRSTFSRPTVPLSNNEEDIFKKMEFGPSESDIKDLTDLFIKLITRQESTSNITFEDIKKNSAYTQIYSRIYDVFEIIQTKLKSPSEILAHLDEMIQVMSNNQRLNLRVLLSDYKNQYKAEDSLEMLIHKIDCYELFQVPDILSDLYTDLQRNLQSRQNKTPKDYQQYVSCFNRIIRNSIQCNDWLKAKELASQVNDATKKDVDLKKTYERFPHEYVRFTFLRGNICEGLNEPDKAIKLYMNGLLSCERKNLGLEIAPSVLKKVSTLYMKKKNFQQALDCLKKLASFYESQDGHYTDRSETYASMGDIAIQQSNLGQGVKMYLKGLDSLKKGNVSNNVQILKVLDKIVTNYINLNEDENALKYALESLSIKKEFYGQNSPQHLEDLKTIASLHTRLENFKAALTYSIKYYDGISQNKEEAQSKYVESIKFLGDAYYQAQQYDKADGYYKKYSELKEHEPGNNDKEYLDSLDKKVQILFKQNSFAKALELQFEALELKKAALASDDYYLILSYNNIGDTYLALKQYSDALKYYKECMTMIKAHKDKKLSKEYSQVFMKIAFAQSKLGNENEALTAIYQSFHGNSARGFNMEMDMEKTVEVYEKLYKLKQSRQNSLNFTHMSVIIE